MSLCRRALVVNGRPGVSSGVAPIAIFVHRGEYEALHQALAIAATAVAQGRPTQVYLFWWALERLARGGLELTEGGAAGERLEARSQPSAQALLEAVRSSPLARVVACSGSLSALGLIPPQVEHAVDEIAGWSTILQRTQGIADRFFL